MTQAPAPMQSPLLQVRDLRVRLATARGSADAVHHLSFDLHRGQALGVVGESGCGKSLTALALMGLAPANARVFGSIRLDDQELIGLPDRQMCRIRGNRIAMVFQEPMTSLDPLQRIGEQVAEPLRIHRGLDSTAAHSQALALLDRVGIAGARARFRAYPHELSGGQRQRVMIAAALACEPDLLIADEPTTALDVTVQRQILGLIGELVGQSGMGLILVSHDLAVIAENVQEILVMYGGTGVELGPVGQVLEHPAHPYTQALLRARPVLGGDLDTPLPVIAGTVPDLLDRPAGCPFRARCEFAQARCGLALPEPVKRAHQHWVRCLRSDEIRPT
jgi:peptide/nickel transport system ATP-binding protein